MDPSCIILSCILFLQMILLLGMLNPIYDVRVVTYNINCFTKYFKKYYIMGIFAYFATIIYHGMYIPLQNIIRLIFSKNIYEVEKLILLSRVEKNYIIAGFSLFLLVVTFAVKALLSYTASLAEICRRSEPLVLSPGSMKEKKMISNENILANLLRVKRSISYETIMFANDMREQFKTMIKSMDTPQSQEPLSSIVESTNGYVL
ncbi:uncharacterized protein LOC114241618 [Bombyx mandarina]|uniref:Uncharacterized protein LOC114241618 n=1 Tax=Bombyx mandarina TaxID=7092 RepID=A0A6J2JGZ4_BOMMA|nr:uncharacterized protein LOC114241618 [Bombyx mandarina]